MSICTNGDHQNLPDGITLCHSCTEQLEQDLAEVDAAWEDLQVTAAKLDKGAGSVGGGGHAGSMEPCNLDALDKGQTLTAVLRGWASHLAVVSPRFHAPAIASRLLCQIRHIRHQEWAGDLCRELRDALNDCRRATDRAGQRVFAGMCPTIERGAECLTPVYTAPGKPFARCGTCGSEWDVAEWRGRALDAAGFHTGTAAEVSRMLSDPVTRECLPQARIRQWVRRGKLAPIGNNRDGRPVYQVRKVRNLWTRMQASTYNHLRDTAPQAA